jgi:hypothetical protein
MRHIFPTLAAGLMAVGGLAGLPSRATSQNPGHDRLHDQLGHNQFHRQSDHRDAHRYPMTWGQHGQVHDQLRHDRFHDRLDHNQSHRDSYYQPYQGYSGYGGAYQSPSQGYGGSYYQPVYGYPGSGFGIQGRRFSLDFGQLEPGGSFRPRRPGTRRRSGVSPGRRESPWSGRSPRTRRPSAGRGCRR